MGKGDRKTKKGKRKRKSYGKTRSKRKNLNKQRKEKKIKFEILKTEIEGLRFLCSQYDLFNLIEVQEINRISKSPTDKNLINSLEKIRRAKSKTINQINDIRAKFFPFSIEEIFVNNGQFDRFVRLEFYPESDAFKKYGESIMGVFIFTQYQRKYLKRYIGQTNYPRSSNKVRFEPSELCSLTINQIEDLKITGIDNRDIRTIYSTSMPYENRYKKRIGYKDIPNTAIIKIRDDGYDYGPAILRIYESRIKQSNYPLIPEEYYDFLSLKLQYIPDKLTKAEKTEIYESDGITIKPDIVDYYIKRRYFQGGELNEEEEKNFKEYIDRISKRGKEAVDKEISKSSSKKLSTIIMENISTYGNALMLASQFMPENLSTYGAKYSIRLGLSGFMHICLRHCNGFQFGDWKNKRTTFEYELKDVIQVIKNIIKKLQNEIDIALDNGKDFQLNKGTSFLYDGNYYAIHIDKNGNLLSFSPRNK